MLTAITRAVSPALASCELTFVDRQPIDIAKAQSQHTAYEHLLAKLGIHVHSLAAEPALPDSMFVEDPAIVLDELAVILPLGTKSRQPEAESLAKALAPFRKLATSPHQPPSKAATSSASTALSTSAKPRAPTPKASANSPPSSRLTTTKSSRFPSPDAYISNPP